MSKKSEKQPEEQQNGYFEIVIPIRGVDGKVIQWREYRTSDAADLAQWYNRNSQGHLSNNKKNRKKKTKKST